MQSNFMSMCNTTLHGACSPHTNQLMRNAWILMKMEQVIRVMRKWMMEQGQRDNTKEKKEENIDLINFQGKAILLTYIMRSQ